MTDLIDNNAKKIVFAPIIFMGVADGATRLQPDTPFESYSLFELSRLKAHFFFPALAQKNAWCFLVNALALSLMEDDLRVQVLGPNGNQVGHATFSKEKISVLPPENHVPVEELNAAESPRFFIRADQWAVTAIYFKELVLNDPGEYRVVASFQGQSQDIGVVVFVYTPPPDLTEETISALEADPTSPKAVKIIFGCRFCNSNITGYAAIKLNPDLEKEGSIFYKNLPDEFECSCKRTKMSLLYAKKSMHGFLLSSKGKFNGISYVQRYAHDQLLAIAKKYLALVSVEKSEAVVQDFLEKNKVLFARFGAKRFFVKPRILGKFNADFAVLDAKGTLVLIEIERPNMKLFRKNNGHLLADFNHAYEQVEDWLNEYAKHPVAVLEGIGLSQNDVLGVRGCVIAGNSKNEKKEHLRRHVAQQRGGIEFLTFDMLGESLVRMSDSLP